VVRRLLLGAALLVACDTRVDFGGTRYQCPDGRCPTGYMCIDAFCELGPPGDDQPDADVPPGPEPDAGVAGPLVNVPGGDFFMGCEIAVDLSCPFDAIPAGFVLLSPYQIERQEVTAAAWEDCRRAGACRSLGAYDARLGDLPVAGVTWDDAVDYCTHVGRRLPTEAEWERAARGDDERDYPWGDQEPNCALASISGCGPARPAGTHPGDQSPVGATEMAGNVAEWVADWYAPGYLGDDIDPTGPADGQEKVVRGGSFQAGAAAARTYARARAAPSAMSPAIGFRCAR
jgi:formylglycine-generating enzyme required for sulfatase activity